MHEFFDFLSSYHRASTKNSKTSESSEGGLEKNKSPLHNIRFRCATLASMGAIHLDSVYQLAKEQLGFSSKKFTKSQLDSAIQNVFKISRMSPESFHTFYMRGDVTPLLTTITDSGEDIPEAEPGWLYKSCFGRKIMMWGPQKVTEIGVSISSPCKVTEIGVSISEEKSKEFKPPLSRTKVELTRCLGSSLDGEMNCLLDGVGDLSVHGISAPVWQAFFQNASDKDLLLNLQFDKPEETIEFFEEFEAVHVSKESEEEEEGPEIREIEDMTKRRLSLSKLYFSGPVRRPFGRWYDFRILLATAPQIPRIVYVGLHLYLHAYLCAVAEGPESATSRERQQNCDRLFLWFYRIHAGLKQTKKIVLGLLWGLVIGGILLLLFRFLFFYILTHQDSES